MPTMVHVEHEMKKNIVSSPFLCSPLACQQEGKTPLDVAKEKGNIGCVTLLERPFKPWTLGPKGSLKGMPSWIKDRAIMVVLCLQHWKLPQEIIDNVLQHCTASVLPYAPCPTAG